MGFEHRGNADNVIKRSENKNRTEFCRDKGKVLQRDEVLSANSNRKGLGPSDGDATHQAQPVITNFPWV